jgi:ankyrin repeat protein
MAKLSIIDNDNFRYINTIGRSGHVETVKLLLEHSNDKNPEDNDRSTPLHDAASSGQVETVKLLLEHADDKNPEDKDGITPLHMAALYGHLEIVHAILPAANVKNPPTYLGVTPSAVAAKNGHQDIANLILNAQEANLPAMLKSMVELHFKMLANCLYIDSAACQSEAGTITFILISDHILDHCPKIDLRSYQDHIAVQ